MTNEPNRKPASQTLGAWIATHRKAWWALGVTGALLLGAIPGIGPILLIGGVMVTWALASMSRSAVTWQGRPAVAVGHRPARAPGGVVRPEQLHVVSRWELEEQIEVVGERYHTRDIRRVFKQAEKPITERGVTLHHVPTFLCPEPSNKYDHNAVRVMVGALLIGYLPAEIASEYAPALLQLADQGEAVGCESRIWAILEDGVAHARVTVQAPAVDTLP